MVSIFTGLGAGFSRGSANILGGAGQLGSALLGRAGENVAVNAATGNLVVSREDEFLVGRGPDIGISRSYNSLADTGDGDNADNWQQSTTRRIFGLTGSANTAGSTVSRLGSDGAAIVYIWDTGRNAYVTSAGSGAYDTLTFSNDVWTWRDGDTQASESYAAHGVDNWRIVSAGDIDGNTLTWSYNGDKLDTVTTADGAWTQYLWSGDQITEIVTGYTDLATSTAQTLTRTRYAYDASDRLIMVTSDLSPQDNAVTDGQTYVVTYTYDGTSNRIASIAQTDGSLLAITYDGSGRVETLTQSVAGGNVRVTSLTYATGYTEVTGPDGQVTRLTYDAAGQLTAITAPAATTGATPQTVRFAYDADGNLVSVTDGRGKVTTYDHDANGNITQIIDPNGNIVDRVYDAANRLITETTYGSDRNGASNPHYSQFAYDSEGHLAFAVNGAGQVTEYLYDADGQLTYTRQYAGNIYPISAAPIVYADIVALRNSLPDLSSVELTRYIYDARGNLAENLTYGTASATGGSSTAEGYSRTYYTYDQAGRLLARNRQGEQAETFVYDGMGRLVASTDVHGGTTTIVFNDPALTTTVTTAAGYVSVSSFNKAGELVSRTDSGVHTTGGTATYAYDANGRLRVVTDATGRSVYTLYDKAGRKVADVNHLGEIVEYRYDQADRLAATVRYATRVGAAQLALLADPANTSDLSAFLPVASAADQWGWTVYDDGGRAVQSIASDGSVAAYAYDQADQLIRTTGYYNRLSAGQIDALKLDPFAAVVLPAAHAKDAITRHFYDEAGQLVGVLDGHGFLSEITYDGAGNKVSETGYAVSTYSADRANGTFATLRTQVAGGSTVDRVARYVYDGQGLLRFTVDALGGITGFAYDAAGRLTTTTEYATPLTLSDFTFAAVKAAVATSGADRVSYTVYDAAGRAAYTIDAEGGVNAFVYDTSGRAVKAIAFADLYDASAGLPTLATMAGWAADPAQASDTANRVTRNWYSERGELLFTVDAANFVRGFIYDAQGRTIGESAWPAGIVVADNATPAQVAALTAGAGSPIALSYSYDSAGRLLTGTDGEGIVTRHVYNALGQRTDTYLADNVSTDTVRLHYEYDATGRQIAEYHAYGSAVQAGSFFAYDGLGNRISTTDANGNTTTFAYDALGRVTSATNALGGVTAYQYDAFGNVLKVTDPRGNASFNYYDRLNRLVATRDAGGYVTRTIYNRFGDAVKTERYATAMTAPGAAGIAVFDPLQVPVDPFAYADSLQAIADDLDMQANQAEANAPLAQADATSTANAASEADVTVADLLAQLTAVGGPQGIDFSAERAVALANTSTWMSNRKTWLTNAANAVQTLITAAPSGAYKDELTNIKTALTSEKNAADLAFLPAGYINAFYDALTLQRSTLATAKSVALADPIAWLQARESDLVNWVAEYNGLLIASSFVSKSKDQWLTVVQAIYDLSNNTYSSGWPAASSLYSSVQSDPAYVPSGLTHTATQTADYRALAIINAYYDAQGAITQSYGVLTQAQQLTLAYNQAVADADAAHDAADAAAAAASAASASAVQLRADATQAQDDADAAYADAQANAGVVLRDDYVLLDLAQLGQVAETRYGYNRLGRIEWTVDAEGYPELYEYNAFGQQTGISRYSQILTGGQSPDPDAPMPPAVIAAFDLAAQKQADADVLATQIANLQANLANALANPLPHLQTHLATLNTQLATLNSDLAALQVQYDNANFFDQLLVYGPRIDDKEDEIAAKQAEITALQTEITRVQNNQGLTSLGTGIIQAQFDPATLQAQYQAAQALADQTLADAQTLQAQAMGMGGTQAYTRFAYDNRGQLTRTTDAEGYFETFVYDAFGRRIAHTDKSASADKIAGGTTVFTYDKRGLLLTETLSIASYTSSGTVQASSVINRYIYDARGNRIARIEAEGLSEQRRTDYTYDKRDRLIETKGDTVSGLTISTANNTVSTVSGQPTATITYDARGNVLATVDEAGAKTVFFYDQLHRKVAEINALGAYTAYEYDANGNVTRIRVFDTTVAVPATGGTAAQAPALPAGTFRETIFTHDARGQMLSSSVLGVTTGQGSGSSWVSSTAAITTSYQYDANGNVVKATDPNGNAIWSFYNKLGRKVAQVDSANYLTSWILDFEGNVAEERRYAVAVTAPNGGATPPVGTSNAADRITQYTYDKNGNRLSETRLNVQFHNGSGAHTTGSASIAWLYNGLGQVTRRTEATGDQTNYTYDAGGRLTREVKAQGATNYFYDGTGNLSRSVQAAVNGNLARTTTYTYGACGRLASMTDAGGNVRTYAYDVAGRLVLESYVRAQATGTAITEAIGHRYDVLGRNLGQAYYTKPSSTWNLLSSGDVSSLQYNAHGDVTKIGVNGLWQQENKYDAAGRVWATNTGDGAWKYFGYDKNGNQTLAVTSAGANLAGQASITAAYGQVSGATVNGTITFYDARNLATSAKEEGRQINTGAAVELTSSRTYNAFGDVVSETNANNATVTYTYNTMGRTIAIQSPQVSITTAAGVVQNATPTENFYYDKSGRLTGKRDANGNLTRYTLLAGSGYGGASALISQEIHADGGTITTAYNAHGDAVQVTDEVGLVTTMTYDNLGRVIQMNSPGGLVDYYAYDVLGQRLSHYNSVLGSGNKELAYYDVQGRITLQRAFGGDTISTTYVWSGTIATTGMGTFGGWTETSTYANGKTTIDKSDMFERVVQHTDMGGFVTNNTYDAAGRLITAATGPTGNTSTMAYVYYNTGQLKQSSLSYTTQTYYWTGTTVVFGTQTNTVDASYTYNKVGNRLTETGSTSLNGTPTTFKSQTATYDALGRLKTWAEAGTTTAPASNISYQYDAAGNVRRSTASYYTLDATGVAATTASTQDYWFRYDTMNRLVIDRGILSGSTIVRNAQNNTSKEILYDKAGRRVNVLTTLYSPPASGSGFAIPGMYHEEREIYTYNAAGSLSQVDLGVGAVAVDATPGTPPTIPAAPTTGTKRSSFTYDAMGRVLTQQDFEADGTTVAYDRAVTYTASNAIQTETAITKRGTDTFKSVSAYDYGSGTTSALGSVLSVTSKNYKNNNDADAKDTSTVNTYVWRDGAMQNTITVDNDTGSTSNALYTTTMYYNAAGRLMSAYISDGKPRSVAYTLDENAQIVRRDETRPSSAPSAQTGSPHEVWYRFGGREMGYTGNNGTDNIAYAASIARRQQGTPSNPGTFRDGGTYAQTYADFAQSYDPINSFSQGASGGSYTVRTGDNLQSIAQTVWGDANLWYKLAEANGITGKAGLIEGQVLQLPAGVIRNAHNAGTVSPYDPAEAIGNVSPTTAPKPPKKKGCGGLGMILIAVVAIAVTMVATAGATAALSGHTFGAVFGAMTGTGAAIGSVSTAAWVAGGAIGGAIGSAVSQGVGVATGLQDKFSWKGVALAGISGAIGGYFQGLSNAAGLAAAGVKGATKLTGVAGFLSRGGITSATARGVIGNVASQGIALATGLQGKFDFAGVAAAGIGAATSSTVGARTQALGRIGSGFLSNTAGAIANAATRSAVNGENFGDNLMRAMPDVIANTIGDIISDTVVSRHTEHQSGLQERENAIVRSSDNPTAVTNPGVPNTEIVVTAQTSVSDLRQHFRTFPSYQIAKIRNSLTEGTPFVAGSAPVVQGVGNIPGGASDPASTLAGAINFYAYFSEGTFDDLGAFLLANYVAPDGSDVADVIERISRETDENDLMLAANITALHATNNPVLGQVAAGLEDVAVERWLDGGQQAAAAADSEVENIVRLNPLIDDFYFARDVIQGRASKLEIGAAVGAQALPMVGALGKRLFAAESRMARAARLGREGERAAGIIRPKVGVTINGRLRFPDEITDSLVKEVKNVKYQGWTKQLQDYADLAYERKVPFELWIRPGPPGVGTTISRNLSAAEQSKKVIFKYIGID
ncbi:putative toxin [Caenibius tardaugens]|nr:putative toxin [Caenibius tardaugens]